MTDRAKLIFLGTGTSHGIPVPGCDCPVCSSDDVRDQRTRASIYISYRGQGLVVDTATEFRLQAVSNDIMRIDAVFYTHAHSDHISGFDDLRGFNLKQGEIPCYGSSKTIGVIRRNYGYAFRETQVGGGKPQVIPGILTEGAETRFQGMVVRSLPVWHGCLSIFGYLFLTDDGHKIAYLTDCSRIPVRTIEQIRGSDILILGALRYREHPTHFNIEQACQTASALNVGQVYLTHICHDVMHRTGSEQLPEGVELAYDGLEILIGK